MFIVSPRQVQKLQNIIASRASQYNHEMKRKEKEFNKLKERLNQLLVDKKEKKQGWVETKSYFHIIFLHISHSEVKATSLRNKLVF